jgi:hypothetical protein
MEQGGLDPNTLRQLAGHAPAIDSDRYLAPQGEIGVGTPVTHEEGVLQRRLRGSHLFEHFDVAVHKPAGADAGCASRAQCRCPGMTTNRRSRRWRS